MGPFRQRKHGTSAAGSRKLPCKRNGGGVPWGRQANNPACRALEVIHADGKRQADGRRDNLIRISLDRKTA